MTGIVFQKKKKKNLSRFSESLFTQNPVPQAHTLWRPAGPNAPPAPRPGTDADLSVKTPVLSRVPLYTFCFRIWTFLLPFTEIFI